MEDALRPFLGKSVRELEQGFSALEQAQLHVQLAQAAAALFSMSLHAQGVDPRQHSFAKEMDHVQIYARKVQKLEQEVELKGARRHTAINIAAANRFINAAIPELSVEQKHALKQVSKRAQDQQEGQPPAAVEPQHSVVEDADAFLRSLGD